MSGIALWITGLPGSGKSALADEIKKAHPGFIVLRMDELRRVVTPEPTYSDEERDMVYRSLIYTAKTLAEMGRDVIMDATGNMRKWRELARRLIPEYAEVYLKCPIKLCMERERNRIEAHAAPRDVYEKGRLGWPVPGMSVPYEEPLSPELVLDTEKTSIKEEAASVKNLIERLKAG